MRQKRKTSSTALQVSRQGQKPVLSEEDRKNIRRCIDERPDIATEEIREGLKLPPSYSAVEHAINAMGYTLKKKSRHASERDRIRCAGEAQRMEKDDTT